MTARKSAVKKAVTKAVKPSGIRTIQLESSSPKFLEEGYFIVDSDNLNAHYQEFDDPDSVFPTEEKALDFAKKGWATPYYIVKYQFVAKVVG